VADLIQAAQQAENLLAMFQGVQAVADALKQVGSIEQAIAESTTRLGVVRGQVDQAQAELDAKKAEVANVANTAQSTIDDAKQQSAVIVLAANNKAQEILQAAADQAASQRSIIDAERAQHDADLLSARDTLAQVQALRDAEQAELDRVKGLVAQIKGAA